MALMDRLTGTTDENGDVYGKVVWMVSYDRDDLDGVGWYIQSLKDSQGPVPSKSEAVEVAFREADLGDVIQIWDRDADEPDLEYVH